MGSKKIDKYEKRRLHSDWKVTCTSSLGRKSRDEQVVSQSANSMMIPRSRFGYRREIPMLSNVRIFTFQRLASEDVDPRTVDSGWSVFHFELLKQETSARWILTTSLCKISFREWNKSVASLFFHLVLVQYPLRLNFHNQHNWSLTSPDFFVVVNQAIIYVGRAMCCWFVTSECSW